MSDHDDNLRAINVDDLATLRWAAHQHLDWRREWESQESGYYPDGQYAAEMQDLETVLDRADRVIG
jgi:hypothetical protein